MEINTQPGRDDVSVDCWEGRRRGELKKKKKKRKPNSNCRSLVNAIKQRRSHPLLPLCDDDIDQPLPPPLRTHQTPDGSICYSPQHVTKPFLPCYFRFILFFSWGGAKLSSSSTYRPMGVNVFLFVILRNRHLHTCREQLRS